VLQAEGALTPNNHQFRQRVLDLLRTKGPQSTQEVVAALEGAQGPTTRCLSSLKDGGHIDYVGMPAKWVYIQRLPPQTGSIPVGSTAAEEAAELVRRREEARTIQCRFCEKKFSKESYRDQHERLAHPSQIVQAPAEQSSGPTTLPAVMPAVEGEAPIERERLREWLDRIAGAAKTLRDALGP